jgi:sulfate permease, SulP family
MPAVRLIPSKGDFAGGITGGIASIAANVPYGVVALAPLGAGAEPSGIVAVLFGAVVGGGVFSLLSRTRVLLAGGSMALSLVIAGVLASLVEHGVLQPGPAGVPAALAVTAMLTLLTGLCEAGIAASGLGRMVPLAPYPVIAGIRNGIGLLMIIVQFRAFVGLSPPGGALSWAHPAALAVALTTFALATFPIAALAFVPHIVVAILAGSLVHYAIAWLAGAHGMGWVVGPVLDTLPTGAEQLGAVVAGWATLPQLPPALMLATLLPAALSIALLSSLETLAGASVMQDVSGEHRSARSDLLALAAGNIAGGLVGGTPITGGPTGSMTVWVAGGRTKAAGMVRTVVLLGAVMVLAPVIGLLPIAVVAGLVVSNSVRVFDRELLLLGYKVVSARLHFGTEMLGNVLVMAMVAGVALAYSIVAAVVTGVALSLLLFVTTMGSGAVRRSYRNPAGRSRTLRSERDTETIRHYGGEIEVIELHGAVFFGSADQLGERVEAALAAGARYVILDFKRVSRIDLSGARRLLQIANRLWRAETWLALASVQPGTLVWSYLEDADLVDQLRPDHAFGAVEEAIARAEDALLAARGEAPLPARDETIHALQRIGIPAEAVSALQQHMLERRFAPDSTIIAAGDSSDAVYVLAEGEVTVVLPAGNSSRRTRVATLTGGTLFGEMALLSGAPRSADVIARTAVRCLSVETATIALLRRTQPELAYCLLAAIAGQLERNLRMANIALRSFEE